ncbi:unnamed protein product [Fraxinus pennsylvanica]|uniref:Stress-response A/B barrel domain-containing protein n=1 Tax=Fraxinus pennsylvanica TaxID=56036 RepID=A0AAD1YQ23_9LAMI|nr:unnamed protein product [Fraxinus pennsylvanica]
MQIQTQIYTLCCAPVLKTAAFSRKPVGLIANKNANLGVSFLGGDSRRNLWQHWRKKNEYPIISAVEEGNLGAHLRRKRGVVEHICLIRAKEDLSEEQEKDMLDYLYTTQYQMRGIIAISLGRISNQGLEKYTHAIFMRFQTKEDISKFYENPFYMGVLKDHVMPYCHAVVDVDYESEVEDDILPIFRKGEEFNYGVESVVLISFNKSSIGRPAQAALDALANLTLAFPSLIVQATKGRNINNSSKEYTHGAVIRFRSFEAYEIFVNSSEYTDIQSARSSCNKEIVLGGSLNGVLVGYIYADLMELARLGLALLGTDLQATEKCGCPALYKTWINPRLPRHLSKASCLLSTGPTRSGSNDTAAWMGFCGVARMASLWMLRPVEQWLTASNTAMTSRNGMGE